MGRCYALRNTTRNVVLSRAAWVRAERGPEWPYNRVVRIERAGPEQASQLTEIAHVAKRSWGYPESMMAAWTEALTVTPEFVSSHPVFIAVEGSQVLGFYGLVTEGEVSVLEHLWVRPESMGGGVGRALLEHAAQVARLGGASALEIDSDPHAEGFYVRNGAVRIGETVSEVLGEPRVLPKLRLVV